MASQNNTEPEESGFDVLIKRQNKATLWALGFLPIFVVLSVGQFLILRNIGPVSLYEQFPFSGVLACADYLGVERLYGDTRIFYSNLIKGIFLTSIFLSVIVAFLNKNIFMFCVLFAKNVFSEKRKYSELLRPYLYNSVFLAIAIFGLYITIDNSCRKFIRHQNSDILLPTSFAIYALTTLAPLYAMSLMGLATGTLCSLRNSSGSKN